MMLLSNNSVGQLFVLTTTLISLASAQFGLGAIPLAPASPPIQTVNTTGRYHVGVRHETYLSQGRNLSMYWWYPALEPTPSNASIPFVSAGGIIGNSIVDAPLDSCEGPYPLILYTPGLGAYPDAYLFYLQNLASHGYVVVSLEHFDTKNAVPTADSALRALAAWYQAANDSSKAVEVTYTEWFRRTQFGLTYRAQEIKDGLDTALARVAVTTSMFYGAVDVEAIGMSGHSLGAYYTLLIGGGLPLNCSYDISPTALNASSYDLTLVSPCAFPLTQNLTTPTSLHDPRIRAILPLAPPLFIESTQLPLAASHITTPLMIITGDDLQLESTRAPQKTIYESVAGRKYWVVVNGTSHYLVGDAYQLNPGFSLTIPVKDKVGFEGKAGAYMGFSVGFFDRELKGSEIAGALLEFGGVVPFVEEYEHHG